MPVQGTGQRLRVGAVLAFIAVQRRLDGEPLEEYIKPVGGGYFFALPGFGEGEDYLGRTLIDAIVPISQDASAARSQPASQSETTAPALR